MEIRQQYLQRYLHDIAIDQLMADYQAKGYQVAKEEKVGNHQADLVAKKEGEVVVVEVKTGKMTPQKRKQVAEIGDYVRTQKNYKFLVVMATPPKPKKIDISNLDQLLLDYFIKNPPYEFRKIPAKIQIKAVTDVNLNEFTLTETGNISVTGNALIEADLQPNPPDDPTVFVEVFPCNFEVVLTYVSSKQLILSEMKGLAIDTSDYFQ